MEFSRADYPALLESLQPSQAVTILHERVKRVDRVNTEIADWLQERRKVEEAYVTGLKKLVRKLPPDESSELGIFAGPWTKIVSSAESIARSHHTLAKGIELDIEQPLRNFAHTNREMQAMSTIQGNLAAMAKEYDAANEKADKIKKKGGKAPAGKVASATTDVENAKSQWNSQAPFVFEKLQAVDESRLNHLRDVLTQFQTHEADQVERSRATAEEVLNVLLNVDTSTEIKSFVNRAVSGRPRLERQRSRNFQPSSLAPSSAIPAADDAASQRSGASGGAPKSTHESRHGGLGGGLKRLGTVISRRRTSTIPQGRTPSPNKQSSDRFSAFGRSSRDVASTSSPRGSAANIPSPPILEEGQASRTSDTPSSPSDGRKQSKDLPNGNKLGPEMTSIGESSFGGLQQLPPVQTGPPITVTGDERRDADGFSVPLPKNDLISQAQQEAFQSESQQPQFKLDIRNHPIQEEDGDAETALANVANTLRAQAAPTRKTGTVRGRRDVRNTVFIPSSQSPEIIFGETPSLQSQQKLSRSAALSAEDPVGSDTQSVRSSRSLSTISSAIVRHPDLHEPGLNTSVVETVSAWLENGQITKAVVIGELALAYNQRSLTGSTTENIRLENFIALEKVAPNPSFVTQLSNRSGEYSLNVNQLSKTTVGFKYQLHLNDSNLKTYVPIILSPAWKVEPKQTSVILTYYLSSDFGVPPRKSVNLRDVTLIIYLEGAKASSCQSKPVGTFSKDKSAVYWRLGEIELATDGAPMKLLARFTTETEAKPGAIDARWEISGNDSRGLGSGLNVSQMQPVSSNPPSAPSTEVDPFADESATPSPGLAWKEVPAVRRITSGKYTTY
ncbi:MAG: hypothetical protein M1814_002669 [Vezdaea aestivalis]|nr:MAG: hypothetical protein M1814_002669 [Vezdaea aestivalis]